MWKSGNLVSVMALAVCLAIGCAAPRAGSKAPSEIPRPEGWRPSSGLSVTNTGSISVIEASRNSSVLVAHAEGAGTGFWLTARHVGTCFHVVGRLVNDTNIPSGWHSVASWQDDGAKRQALVADNIKVQTATGDVFEAEVVSFPGSLDRDGSPFANDFAILKVKTVPTKAHGCLTVAPVGTKFRIGDEVVFSGYPLDSPAFVGMVTLRGMVGGQRPDNQLFAIQSSINKGNSGGAVLTTKGEVIGILTLREGGLSQELNKVRNIIRGNGSGMDNVLMGVKPNQTFLEIVDTLDKYISVGIGYARSTESLRKYCEDHPYVLK